MLSERLNDTNIKVNKEVYSSFTIKKELIEKEGWQTAGIKLHDCLVNLYDKGYLTIKPVLSNIHFRPGEYEELFEVEMLFDAEVI